MKYWLLAALLANMALLLVEIHNGVFDFSESKITESRPQTNQLSYSSNKDRLERTLMHAPQPVLTLDENAENLIENSSDSFANKQDSPWNKTSSPDTSGQISPADSIHTSGAKINGNTDANRMNSPPSSPPTQTSTQRPSTKEMQATETSESPQRIGALLTEPAIQSERNSTEKIAASKDQTKSPEELQVAAQQDGMLSACYTTGRIKNAAQFSTLLDQYRRQVAELTISPKKTGKHLSYWVYYPAPATMEQSQTNAEILKNQYNIKDIQIIREGELKGAISLGIFSNERKAILAQNHLKQKGLQVEIRPRFPSEAFYTVKVRWTERQANATLQFIDALAKSYPELKRMDLCE